MQPIRLYSQYYGSTELDSLINVCNNYRKQDVNKVNLYNQISRELFWYQPALGKEYAAKAEALSSGLSYKDGIGYAILNRLVNELENNTFIGKVDPEIRDKNNKYLKGIHNALLLFQQSKNIAGQIQAYLDLSYFYNKIKSSALAIEYAYSAVELNKIATRKEYSALIHLELFKAKMMSNDTLAAKEHMNLCFNMFLKNGLKKELIHSYFVVASTYEKIFDYNAAFKYYSKAVSLSKNSNYYYDYALALNQMASSLDDLYETDKSFEPGLCNRKSPCFIF